MLERKRIEVVALFAAASVFVQVAGTRAADLGGNCCADLEERVAELEATTARKGNRKVSLTVYGELNRALLYWDDGTENNVYVVTNQTTKNLLGFEGAASIAPQVNAGFRLELEIWSANSDSVDQGQVLGGAVLGFPDSRGSGASGILDRQLVTRHANWWIEHKSLGRITVGHGSDATDGIAETDLSGSTAVSGSAVETWNEGFFLTDKNTGRHVFPGFTNQGLFVEIFRGNFDGGRGNLVRYDTPVFGGFVASASWGEDDDWDVALRYASEFSGFQIAAGIGYHEGKIADTENLDLVLAEGNGLRNHNEWTGSASVLHVSSGLFVTVAGGSRDWPDTPLNPIPLLGESYVYGKTGIFQKWIALGKTSLYGEYYHVWDVGLPSGTVIPDNLGNPFNVCDARCNEEASAWGVGVVQHIDAAAMEIYAAYRHYWANDITDTVSQRNTLTDHDIEFDAVMSGARIKF